MLIIEQKLMKEMLDAVNQAIKTKSTSDIDAANKLISNIKNTYDTTLLLWIDTVISQSGFDLLSVSYKK